jgi:diacylglycerol O-acyltransferase / wax synthase
LRRVERGSCLAVFRGRTPMSAGRERMSSVDVAWLRMDRAANHMMIVGLMVLADRIDIEEFKRVLRSRWLRYRRFRQRVVDDVLGPMWVDQRAFDLDLHVQLTALPGRAGKRELEALLSNLASTPLDPERPRWKFHLVEKYGKGSAIVMRIHHCYADGIAMIRVLLSLTAASRAESLASGSEGRAAGRRSRKNRESAPLPWLVALLPPAAEIIEAALRQGQSLLDTSLELARNPEKALELAKHAVGLAQELAKLALLPSEPATSLKGTLSGHKLAAWTRPLPLARVKTLSRRLDCTINDVLMSLVAGVLGEHLRDGGYTNPDLEIRASVPVNLRPAAETPTLGNRFGLVFVTLPVGETDPVARVRRLHATMSSLKQSYQPVLVLGILAALGVAPEAIHSSAVDIFSSKASLVASNVPGPREPLYLAGGRIAEQMFWVPQSGSIGVGVSILTYAGRIHFGLIADRLLVPHPARLVNRLPAALEALEAAAARIPSHVKASA